MIQLSKICDCEDVSGSSELNEDGIVTHGLILGGCGKIRRTAVFECDMCGERSVSTKTTHVRNDLNHIYYCDDCQREYSFPPVDCSAKKCHNWPN